MALHNKSHPNYARMMELADIPNLKFGAFERGDSNSPTGILPTHGRSWWLVIEEEHWEKINASNSPQMLTAVLIWKDAREGGSTPPPPFREIDANSNFTEVGKVDNV